MILDEATQKHYEQFNGKEVFRELQFLTWTLLSWLFLFGFRRSLP